MGNKYWDEWDELGQKLDTLSRLLERAKEYGDNHQVQQLNAQIGDVQQKRDKILVAIAELSIAA